VGPASQSRTRLEFDSQDSTESTLRIGSAQGVYSSRRSWTFSKVGSGITSAVPRRRRRNRSRCGREAPRDAGPQDRRLDRIHRQDRNIERATDRLIELALAGGGKAGQDEHAPEDTPSGRCGSQICS
jgi:hypothetical protein